MNNNTKISRLATPLVPIAAGLAALLAPPAGAVEALLSVDSYVSASQPATNFGTAETLPVGNGNRALLRFDIGSMLPAGTTAGQVAKAVLNVWVSGVSQAGSVAVSELLGSWTEPGVTGATLPGVGPAFATKAVSTAGRWVPIGVTTQVKKWLTDPTTNKGLLIAPAAAAPATVVALDSKENTATSHPARLEIELTGTLGGSYTLVVGKNAGDSTGRSQLAVADFTTITAALNSIPAGLYSRSGCSARYLVKVLPGTYAERVTMKPCVDIEGSGELTTKITAAGATTYDAAATVIGASEAELRFLTVESTGGAVGAPDAIGIYNNGASPRLTHVTLTATASDGINSYGMYNTYSSPVMTDVTATASGAYRNYGVYNYNSSSPAMTNVTATASGGTGVNIGVYNYSSAAPAAMTNVISTASGDADWNAGVYNNSSSPKMANVTATVSGAYFNYGVYNYSSSPAMMYVTATASGGNWSSGVFNDSSAPTMSDVTATSSGGTDNNYGVYNINSSAPAMTNVTATAFGIKSVGMYNASSSTMILNSTLHGATYSLYNYSGTVRVGASRLDGAVTGPATCAASFNGSFALLNASCQ
jgi:hypothetical protein